MNNKISTQVVVLGSGPAGYSAAFRCADLGLKTVIVERYNTLGGVCLNVGCIPSKSLLYSVKIIEEVKNASKRGIVFNELKIDINKINYWKDKVITQLTRNLLDMAKIRKVKIVNGIGRFISSHILSVKNKDDETVVSFDNAIIAVGSRPINLSFIPYHDSRIWDSTDALKLKEIPKRMLVIGGGIIGLEISTIYNSLGSEIDIVEIFDQVIPAADKDVINIFTKCINNKLNLMLETKVISVESKNDGIYVTTQDKMSYTKTQRYDIVLVAIGRIPNSNNLGIDKIGITIDDRGFICVDEQLRTSVPHIFAIGDVIGQPMLAHKGLYEGHVVAKVISGLNYYFNSSVIPCVAYTYPEVGWVGLTEKQAREKGVNYEVAIFPWTASGKAITSNCTCGITKLIFNKASNRIIGGAIVGNNGGELLGEIGLAIEMGCDVEDISGTIHAHPTLSESIELAAQVFEGSITDLPNKKVKIK